jgi:hypothetical protein
MFRGFEKGLKEDCVKNVLLDQFNEFEETRSLDNLFIFRESEKGLKKTRGGYDSCMQLVQVEPTTRFKPRVSSIVNLESLPKGKKTQTTV